MYTIFFYAWVIFVLFFSAAGQPATARDGAREIGGPVLARLQLGRMSGRSARSQMQRTAPPAGSGGFIFGLNEKPRMSGGNRLEYGCHIGIIRFNRR